MMEIPAKNSYWKNESGQPVGRPVPDWIPPDLPEYHRLKGQYCDLVPLDPELHGTDLFQSFQQDVQGQNWTWLPYGPFSSKKKFLTWMNEFCFCKEHLFYAVVPHHSRAADGLTSYCRILPQNGSIETGHIHYSNTLKKKPATTEASFLLIDHAFKSGYRRVEWKCDSFNHASRNAAERLGFVYEGTFRNERVYKGRNRDTSWFSITCDEWIELKPLHLKWLQSNNFRADGSQVLRLSHLTSSKTK